MRCLVLLVAGCGLVTVNGKPLSSSNSSSTASPPSRRVDNPVAELASRRAAQAAQEPKLPPLKQATLPASLGPKPMIVDVEAAPSMALSKRWDFAGTPCAEAMAPAPLVEFEVTAATSKFLAVGFNHGPEGILIEKPDGSALVQCSGSGNQDRATIWTPKTGWAPGRYRVYLVAYRVATQPQEVEVQFSAIEPARPANEVWVESCYADYQDLRTKWGPIEATTRAAIAAIDGGDFYRDYPKLVDLYVGLSKQMAALKINAGVSYEHTRSVGIALELRRALTALQLRHKRDYFEAIQLKGLFPHFTTGDDAFDRDVYCYEATALGSPRVKPRWEGHLEEPWWMKRPEQRVFLERYQALREEGRKAAAFTPGRKVGRDAGFVGAVRRQGKDMVVVLETYNSRPDCWETNKVERVGADGTVFYRKECSGKWTPQTTSRRKVEIAADLVPSKPAIKVRDYVDFYVDPDTLVEDKPSRGFSLISIHRGEQDTVIGDWSLNIELRGR